jgi:hypothetical protein
MTDQRQQRSRDVILLTPGNTAQEERWRTAANGSQCLTTVAVGRRTNTEWKTMTTDIDDEDD